MNRSVSEDPSVVWHSPSRRLPWNHHECCPSELVKESQRAKAVTERKIQVGLATGNVHDVSTCCGTYLAPWHSSEIAQPWIAIRPCMKRLSRATPPALHALSGAPVLSPEPHCSPFAPQVL